MKKILLSIIIFIFSLFIYHPNIYAINYYEEVNIKTVFEDDINTDDIEWINVVLNDSTGYSKEYLLEKDKNFEISVDNVPVGPYSFSYGVVSNDNIGYYRVSGEININEETKIVDVTIIVTLQNNKKHNNVTIDDETKQDIIGDSTNKTTKKADTTETDDEEDSDIIIGEDNEEKESEEDIPEAIKKEREKEQEEIEKAKNRKRNSFIGKILFSIIGIVLLVGSIFVAIKISRANK